MYGTSALAEVHDKHLAAKACAEERGVARKTLHLVEENEKACFFAGHRDRAAMDTRLNSLRGEMRFREGTASIGIRAGQYRDAPRWAGQGVADALEEVI